MQLIRKAFKRLHYPVDIIAQDIRWYLAYSLSLQNLEKIMAQRVRLSLSIPRTVLANGRNLYQNQRPAEISVPGSRYGRPDHRLSADG